MRRYGIHYTTSSTQVSTPMPRSNTGNARAERRHLAIPAAPAEVRSRGGREPKAPAPDGGEPSQETEGRAAPQRGGRCTRREAKGCASDSSRWLEPFITHEAYTQCLMPKRWAISWQSTMPQPAGQTTGRCGREAATLFRATQADAAHMSHASLASAWAARCPRASRASAPSPSRASPATVQLLRNLVRRLFSPHGPLAARERQQRVPDAPGICSSPNQRLRDLRRGRAICAVAVPTCSWWASCTIASASSSGGGSGAAGAYVGHRRFEKLSVRRVELLTRSAKPAAATRRAPRARCRAALNGARARCAHHSRAAINP